MKVAWVTTWHRVCGIADYSRELWPAVKERVERDGGSGVLISLDDDGGRDRGATDVAAELAAAKPDLIHFQHEYGLYGGKNPPLYRFPRLVTVLRRELPDARLIATAHTVLAPEYSFPVRRRGAQAPLRALANVFLLPALRRLWGPETWGALDAVIVHSALQKRLVRRLAPGVRVEEIPHFVPDPPAPAPSETHPALREIGSGAVILVFGFFTPEKGQDVAIDALGRLADASATMILAGGVRRDLDRRFFEQCMARIRKLGLQDRVRVTGFVDPEHVDSLYERADLVLAPFRETTGSGSLAHAFAHGAAILASDLPLNVEIAGREPGALEFFRAEDARSCAEQMDQLLAEPARRASLRHAARRYARAQSVERIAGRTSALYRQTLRKYTWKSM